MATHKKVRFGSASEAIYASAKEAERRGCDMTSTFTWWAWFKDDEGWYLAVTTDEGSIDNE